MDLQELQRMSNEDFTNYAGEDEGYTGYGDDFLDFAGKGLSFAQELSAKHTYTATVINNTGAQVELILFASYATRGLPTAALSQLYILKDGVIGGAVGATIDGSGSPSSIKNFTDFVYLNATNISGMKITSNQPDQIAQKITIESASPYKKLENYTIDLASYTSETNNNDKMVTVKESFQADCQTDISITIPAAARTTFTFYIGATLNTAKSLAKKSQRASQAPSVQAAKARIGR